MEKLVFEMGKTGLTKILGNALMRNTAERDTLYLSADTLYAYEAIDYFTD